MSQNKLTPSPAWYLLLPHGYNSGLNEISIFCVYIHVLNWYLVYIDNDQSDWTGSYLRQNSGRFNVKFSSFGDWYYVSTVNIATS